MTSFCAKNRKIGFLGMGPYLDKVLRQAGLQVVFASQHVLRSGLGLAGSDSNLALGVNHT